MAVARRLPGLQLVADRLVGDDRVGIGEAGQVEFYLGQVAEERGRHEADGDTGGVGHDFPESHPGTVALVPFWLGLGERLLPLGAATHDRHPDRGPLRNRLDDNRQF